MRAVCDDVMVLYAGRIVESMPASRIDATLHHPYARLLFASVPKLQPGWLEETAMPAVAAAVGKCLRRNPPEDASSSAVAGQDARAVR